MRRYSSFAEDPLEASEAYGFDRLLERKVHRAVIKLRAISLFKQAGAEAAAITIQAGARSQSARRLVQRRRHCSSPSLAAKDSQSLEQRVGAFLLTWDVLVPIFTWIVFLHFFCVPPYARVLPLALWMGPVIFPSLRLGGLGAAALRLVAKKKKLCVSHTQPPPDATQTPCIYGFHPHGRYPMLIFPWLENHPEFHQLKVAQSSLGKAVPTVGYVTALTGRVVDATRRAITKTLEDAWHVGVFPGGAREMVLCEPYARSIPLVKHAGFLRLARQRVTDGQPTKVVPVFIFGMHDSYHNPLARLDAALFDLTGVNLPLWLPTAACGGPYWMVCGAALDPLDFSTEESLVDAYYEAVFGLFNAHKSSMPAYVDRTIEFIEVDKSQRAMRTRDIAGHVFATRIAIGFTILFGAIFALTRVLLGFSTLERFAPPKWPALLVHVVSTIGWALSSGNVTIKGFHRNHRLIGRIAVACCLLMSGSAFHLSLTGSLDGGVLIGAELPGLTAFHAAFHAFSNMQVAGIVPLLLGYAIAAAMAGDGQEHQRYMAMTHVLVAANFLPRVSSAAFRFFFPMLSHAANFSIACALQWRMQLSAIAASRLRYQLGCANAFVAALSMFILVIVDTQAPTPALPLCPESPWWPLAWKQLRGADGECRLTSYAVTDGSLAWCDGSRSSCATDLVLCCAIGCPLVCISAGLVWWRMSLTRPQE